jgi:hypothetical protein
MQDKRARRGTAAVGDTTISRRIGLLVVGVGTVGVLLAVGLGIGLNKFITHRRAVRAEHRAQEVFADYEAKIEAAFDLARSGFTLTPLRDAVGAVREVQARAAIDLDATTRQGPVCTAYSDCLAALEEALRLYETYCRNPRERRAEMQQCFKCFDKAAAAYRRAQQAQGK